MTTTMIMRVLSLTILAAANKVAADHISPLQCTASDFDDNLIAHWPPTQFKTYPDGSPLQYFNSTFNPLDVDSDTHAPMIVQTGPSSFIIRVPHAMDAPGSSQKFTQGHFIQTIFATDIFGNLLANVTLVPGQDDIAKLQFDLERNHNVSAIIPWSVCNVHQGWVGKPVIVIPDVCANRTLESGMCMSAMQENETPAVSSFSLDGGRLIVMRVVDDELLVTFTMPVDTWMGFGMGTQMTGADILMARRTVDSDGELTSDSNAYSCNDMFVKSKDTGPVLDKSIGGSSSARLVDDIVVDFGMVRMTCARPLVATDSEFDSPVDVDSQAVVYAFGTGPQLKQHRILDRRQGSVSLNEGGNINLGGCDEKHDFIVMHAVLMSVLWGVLVPFGAAIVRYQKHRLWWLGAHRFIQTTGSLLTIPSIFLAIGFIDQGEHVASMHARLGTTIALFSTLQSGLGLTVVLLSKLGRRSFLYLVKDESLSCKLRVELYRKVTIERRDWTHERVHILNDLTEEQRHAVVAAEQRFFDNLPWYRQPLAKLLPLKHVIVNPTHRYLGRSLTIVAFVQIHLGAELLDATPVIRQTVEVWTIAFSAFVLYKECEMFFGLPRGILAKFALFFREMCRKERKQLENDSNNGKRPETKAINGNDKFNGYFDRVNDSNACKVVLSAAEQDSAVESSLQIGQRYGEEASAEEADQETNEPQQQQQPQETGTGPQHVALEISKGEQPSADELAALSACLAEIGEEEAAEENQLVHNVDKVVAAERDGHDLDNAQELGLQPRLGGAYAAASAEAGGVRQSERKRQSRNNWSLLNPRKTKTGMEQRRKSIRKTFVLPGVDESSRIGNQLMQQETNDILRNTFSNLERELEQVKATVDGLGSVGVGAAGAGGDAAKQALDRYKRSLNHAQNSMKTFEETIPEGTDVNYNNVVAETNVIAGANENNTQHSWTKMEETIPENTAVDDTTNAVAGTNVIAGANDNNAYAHPIDSDVIADRKTNSVIAGAKYNNVDAGMNTDLREE